MTENKPHILFVDDESFILQGLKRGMRRHRNIWHMSFANSGMEALEIASKGRVDIIVSDMQMPQMDGAELLEKMKEKSPDTARVVLSGYAKDEVVLKVIGPAHQYLAKPCDFKALEDTLERILKLRDCLGNENIREIITGKTTIPSLPDIYSQLLAELENPNSNNKSIAAIVENDLGLKAQILKVCNSAFFGLPTTVSSLESAVSMLGLNTLRSMTLLQGVFSTLSGSNHQALQKLTANSINVALIASKIAKMWNLDSSVRDIITSAGSLSHIGSLLIAANWPDEFAKVCRECDQSSGKTIVELERQLIGTDHGVIGAYLLGLWGFPLSLCEAVAYHHNPSQIGERQHPVLATLHIAQHVAKALHLNKTDFEDFQAGLDMDFLKKQNLSFHEDMLETIKDT